MCGRFSIGTPADVLAAVFKVASMPQFELRYNIAPSQDVPVIRADGSGTRRMEMLRWGFVPHWADDPAIGNRMINARSEGVGEKPAFRSAFKSRRCLVPADAFYEWKKLSKGKQPYAIRMRDRRPFAMAGLWETWRSREGQPLESFTILTTEPNELVKPLHNRMPVILDPADYETWLNPEPKDLEKIKAMLHAPPAENMVAYPVSPRMNKPEHDEPDCLQPIELKPAPKQAKPEQETLF
jgi:putative SOS response-associated peptidase YedK